MRTPGMIREFRGLFEVDLGRGLSAESGFFSLLLTFPSGVAAADNFPFKLKGSDLKRKIAEVSRKLKNVCGTNYEH